MMFLVFLVNSVFVYDDKVVLTFDYSGDDRTMTLKEIDTGLQQGVRIPETNAYQKEGCPDGHPSFWLWGKGTRKNKCKAPVEPCLPPDPTAAVP